MFDEVFKLLSTVFKKSYRLLVNDSVYDIILSAILIVFLVITHFVQNLLYVNTHKHLLYFSLL